MVVLTVAIHAIGPNSMALLAFPADLLEALRKSPMANSVRWRRGAKAASMKLPDSSKISSAGPSRQYRTASTGLHRRGIESRGRMDDHFAAPADTEGQRELPKNA